MDFLRAGHFERLYSTPQVSQHGPPVSNLGLSIRPARIPTRCGMVNYQYTVYQASRIRLRTCLDGRWIAVVLVLSERE